MSGQAERSVRCHESCVVELIRKTLRERESGQREFAWEGDPS